MYIPKFLISAYAVFTACMLGALMSLTSILLYDAVYPESAPLTAVTRIPDSLESRGPIYP